MKDIYNMIKVENLGLILSICIIIYLVFFDKCRTGARLEHMSEYNAEAMATLASMYTDGKLMIDDLEVQNNVTIKGTLGMTGDINATNVNVSGNTAFGDTQLLEGTNGSLKVKTPHGWGEFGPQNDKWLHIKTDRDKIYSGKETHIDGELATYEKDGGIPNMAELRKLSSFTKIGGYAVDEEGTTLLLEEGSHVLKKNVSANKYGFDATNNEWNVLYLFRGWKLETWDKEEIGNTGDNQGAVTNTSNTNEDIKRVDVTGGKVSAFRLTWIGY